MKKAIVLLLVLSGFIAKAQFPSTDSLRNFNNRHITNDPKPAFTNLRLHNLLAGMIDFIDTAMFGGGGSIELGVDTIWAPTDSTIRYRKNGSFRTFTHKGVYDYRRKVDSIYKINDTTLAFKINGTQRTVILPGAVYVNQINDTSFSINGDTVEITGRTYTVGAVLYAGADGKPVGNIGKAFFDHTNTRLGINNSSPEYTLDVNGLVVTRGGSGGFVTMAQDLSGLGFSLYSPTVRQLRIHNFADNTDDMAFKNMNVGIGTTDPAYKLHVIGQIAMGGSQAGFLLRDRATNTDSYQFYSPVLNEARIFNHQTGDEYYFKSGNFGVGITPVHRLHVSGNVGITSGALLFTNNTAAFGGTPMIGRFGTSLNHSADGHTFNNLANNANFLTVNSTSITVPPLASGSTPPTTSGTRRYVVSDANGLFSIDNASTVGAAGANISNTALTWNGNYTQNVNHKNFFFDTVGWMNVNGIEQDDTYTNKTRFRMYWYPSFAFTGFQILNAHRNAANNGDSILTGLTMNGAQNNFYYQRGSNSSIVKAVEGSTTLSTTNGTASTQLAVTNTYISLSASDSVMIKAESATRIDTILAANRITVAGGINKVLKAPESAVSGRLFTQTATTSVTSTTSETNLNGTGTGTLTIPANYMAVGDNYTLTLRGFYSTDATNPATLTFRVKLGGTTYATTTAITIGAARTSLAWEAEVDITVFTIGSGGTVMVNGMFRNEEDAMNKLHNGTTTQSINTTTSQAVTYTIQLSDASAGNSVTLTNATLRRK